MNTTGVEARAASDDDGWFRPVEMVKALRGCVRIRENGKVRSPSEICRSKSGLRWEEGKAERRRKGEG